MPSHLSKVTQGSQNSNLGLAQCCSEYLQQLCQHRLGVRVGELKPTSSDTGCGLGRGDWNLPVLPRFLIQNTPHLPPTPHFLESCSFRALPHQHTSIPDDSGWGDPGRLTHQHSLLPNGHQHHGIYSRDRRWVCMGKRCRIWNQTSKVIKKVLHSFRGPSPSSQLLPYQPPCRPWSTPGSMPPPGPSTCDPVPTVTLRQGSLPQRGHDRVLGVAAASLLPPAHVPPVGSLFLTAPSASGSIPLACVCLLLRIQAPPRQGPWFTAMPPVRYVTDKCSINTDGRQGGREGRRPLSCDVMLMARVPV